ncbi:MAG: response regulator transcription factor [Bacteroidota bacterium]
MKNIRFLIVDDEPLAHELLENLLQSIPHFECIGHFYDAISVQYFLKRDTPDLIFLDVDMPGLNGLELLKSIDEKINVIIVTGHRKYAMKSFDPRVIDFLLKPVRVEKLKIALQKFIDKNKKQDYYDNIESKIKSHNESINYFFAKNDAGKFEKVLFSDIVMVTKDYNDLNLVIKDGSKLHTPYNLNCYQAILPEKEYVRVSKCSVVRKDCIINHTDSTCTLNVDNSKPIKITKRYIHEVNKQNKLVN